MYRLTQHTTQKFDPQPFGDRARLFPQGLEFDIYSACSSGRLQVEGYISEQFNTIHNAAISEFMPQLLTMRCLGELSAVAGLRAAGSHSLFLEQYFSRPIEQVIEKNSGRSIDRSWILEIGNLVATRRGSSQLLFVLLAELLKQADFEWVVVTATPQVEKSLRRLGIEIYILGDADPALLAKSTADAWGSYYDCKPRVIAGRVCTELTERRSGKKLAAMLSLYQREIKALAASLSSQRFV